MTQELYIADTNILVHLIRRDTLGQQIIARYDPYMTDVPPAYCIVSAGEIRSLSLQWHWGQAKLDAMRFTLSYFRRLSIETPDVIEAYASIDAYCKQTGIVLSKNDLWIAAVANANGVTLLTTDHDFDPLHTIFLTRILVQPVPEKEVTLPPPANDKLQTEE